MNDNKISYTVYWSQSYPAEFVTIDLTETIAELKLEQSEYTEALNIINMIRNKK